ncbi:unnamed protein product [Cladocopium goreaui]|uniref:Uncharacterized protein n=1 Tax=Cladocopium goreaui TaxID=2562237 RepID=A0A9P1GF58_9DINO|nr:unnamed protein product [Cladocopium goreaui]CAI4011681.1 unnamed protein product [Cladocopium goreaui]
MCNVAGRHRKAIGNIGWGCHGYLKTPLNRRPATPPASERHRENREKCVLMLSHLAVSDSAEGKVPPVPKLPPFHVPKQGEVAEFFAPWSGAVQPEASDHAETPPPKRRVISPSTSFTSKASSGSMSAPSPVQWPALLPSSRELEPALALAESMSPAAYSRSSTVDYTKGVPTPPTKKASACRGVCTAAKTSASPPLAHSTMVLKRRPPATPASAATPLVLPACPPAKAHAYADAEHDTHMAEQPKSPMPTAKAVPKPIPTAKVAACQPATQAPEPTPSHESTETPQSTPPQMHPAKDSHGPAKVQLDSARAGILRHKKAQPSGLSVKWELDTPAPPVLPPDLETPNNAPQAESPALAKAKAQPPLTPAAQPAQPVRRPAAQITVATGEDGAPQPIEPATYNERQALQGEFKRRLRDPEAHDIPDEVVEAWEAAVKTNTKAAKTALFEKWLKAGKNWSLLHVENSRTHTDRSTSTRKMRWRTKAQIIADHGGDTDAADSIIKKKIAAGLVQDHPDDDDLKTYYVTVELGKKDEEETANTLKMAAKAKINCGGQASLKLTKGCKPEECLNLRTNQKEAPAPATVLGVPKAKAKSKPKQAKTKEMPDEVVPGLQWMVPQILKDLSQAKMWPVKLAHLKHQDKLRDNLVAAAKELEDYYYTLKSILDQFEKEKSHLDEDRAAEILIDANAGRDSYLENAAMATQLCKPKGGKRKVRLGWGLPHHNVQCLGSKLCTLKGWLMNV